MEIVFIAIGIIIGLIIGFLLGRNNASKEIINLQAKEQAAQQRFIDIQSQIDKASLENKVKQDEIISLNQKVAQADSEIVFANQKLKEKQLEVDNTNQKLTTEFKNIAQEIIEQKGRLIATENKDNIEAILNPLRQRIIEFEKTISDTNTKVLTDNSQLRQQLKSLSELNQNIGKEAQNLVNALKGNTKTQGNWGEMVLEKILERSGLEKDREYRTQASFTHEDNRRVQPDVIVMLPENKSVIIDSKVSLIAYEQYISNDDEIIKKKFAQEHVASIRTHVKQLSDKKYQSLYELKTVDFVILFVPVESAFALAVQEYNDLWSEAFDKNIVIVSTSTLLATLRTIAMMWRQDKTNKNAMEIARQSGDLYDKFNGFVDDMLKVGNSMNTSKTAYDSAMNKLTTGNGNIIKKLEGIKKLGANASKSLPQQLIDRAED
jgi:DNA recombination protein RmuC